MAADLEQRAKNPQKAKLTGTSEGDDRPCDPLGTLNAYACPLRLLPQQRPSCCVS